MATHGQMSEIECRSLIPYRTGVSDTLTTNIPVSTSQSLSILLSSRTYLLVYSAPSPLASTHKSTLSLLFFLSPGTHLFFVFALIPVFPEEQEFLNEYLATRREHQISSRQRSLLDQTTALSFLSQPGVNGTKIYSQILSGYFKPYSVSQPPFLSGWLNRGSFRFESWDEQVSIISSCKLIEISSAFEHSTLGLQ